MTIQFECARCGQRLRGNESRTGSLVRCSKCQGVSAVPAAVPPAAIESDPEPCPKCGKQIAAKAVLCIECGFNRNTGQQFKTKSIRRTLHWGKSPYTPLRFFAASVCILGAMGVVVLVVAVAMRDSDSEWWYGLGLQVFPLLGLVIAGSSYRYTVTRDAKGTPVLRHRSWFCFFAVRGNTYPLNDYDGLFLDYVPPVGRSAEQYILQLRRKKDHEMFDTIYTGDQGMMSELVDGVKEFTNLQLERR